MQQTGSGTRKIEIAGAAAAFACPAGQSLLKAMIMAGKSGVSVGCRSGGCGVCRIRVLGGAYDSLKMSRSRISEADEAEGVVLACRVLPRSDMQIEPMPIGASQ